MTNELALITNLLPAAILVLDDLPAEIFDETNVARIATASTALEGRIYKRIEVLIAYTKQMVDSLDSPYVTAQTATMLQTATTDDDPSGIARVNSPSCGFESEMLRVVLSRPEDKDQRVVADLQLMLALVR